MQLFENEAHNVQLLALQLRETVVSRFWQFDNFFNQREKVVLTLFWLLKIDGNFMERMEIPGLSVVILSEAFHTSLYHQITNQQQIQEQLSTL